MLLLGGGVAAASIMLPHLPHERQLELRIEDRDQLSSVELTVSSPSATDEAEAPFVMGSSWHFPDGRVPASLVTSMRVPDGRYEVDVVLLRAGTRQSIHRTIAFHDAERITVPIR